jgi:peptidyl-prolyl cis-trans isomerase D
VQQPDSVQYRIITVAGTDDKAKKSADSIYTALMAGAPIDTIAKKYNQAAEAQWITSAQVGTSNLRDDDRKFVNLLFTSPAGSYQRLELSGGSFIVKVTDRRNIVTKYDVAVIKRSIDFSKDTYNKAFNDFSSFLAGNAKAEEIEANAAQAGYNVQTRNSVSNTEHTIANVRSTRDAMRWLFNEDTKVGDISPLYECGENDHLLVIMLTGIHKKGYLSWDDEQIRSFLTSEVMKDKKAALLAEKMNAAKSVADVAKIEGAVTDTIKHVTFASNAFISKVGSSEPALSGSVSKAKKGDFKSGIKGKAAVYAYQVRDQKKLDIKYDQKEEEMKLQQSIARNLGGYFGELFQKADVSDNRYIFY